MVANTYRLVIETVLGEKAKVLMAPTQQQALELMDRAPSLITLDGNVPVSIGGAPSSTVPLAENLRQSWGYQGTMVAISADPMLSRLLVLAGCNCQIAKYGATFFDQFRAILQQTCT